MARVNGHESPIVTLRDFSFERMSVPHGFHATSASQSEKLQC